MICEEGSQSLLISVEGLCKNTIPNSSNTISYRLSLYVLALFTCGTLNSTDAETMTADCKSASELRSRAPHTLSEKPNWLSWALRGSGLRFGPLGRAWYEEGKKE